MYNLGLHILEKLHYLSDILKYLSDFKWFSNQRNWKKSIVMLMEFDPIQTTNKMLKNDVLLIFGCWDLSVEKIKSFKWSM